MNEAVKMAGINYNESTAIAGSDTIE